jgi:hypothetical protein
VRFSGTVTPLIFRRFNAFFLLIFTAWVIEKFGFTYRSAREHRVMVIPNKGGHVALPSDHIEIKKGLLQSLIRQVARLTDKEPDEVRDILFD